MDAPIAVAHMGGGDLLDPFDQLSLPGSTGAVVVGRAIDRQFAAGTSNAHLPAKSPPCDPQVVPPEGFCWSIRLGVFLEDYRGLGLLVGGGDEQGGKLITIN